MQFTSDYKSLVVKFGHDTKVKFLGGKVEVEGDTARKLAEFAERNPHYAIVAHGDVEAEVVDPYKGKRAKSLLKEIEARGLDNPGEDTERDDLVAILVADDEAKAEAQQSPAGDPVNEGEAGQQGNDTDE